MGKIKKIQLLLLLCIISGFSVAQNSTYSTGNMHLADPSIVVHNKVYYLFGTIETGESNGFKAYKSNDLIRWEKDSINTSGYALCKGNSYGTSGFWAPQVFNYNNTFYMAYVADESIAMATSKSVSGPFTQVNISNFKSSVRQIDPFVFIDSDGKKYLYYVRVNDGNRIFVALLNDDFSDIQPGTAKECIVANLPWENTANSSWPVAEGPTVIKHKGVYYLIYTANDFRNPDYAVGYATSTSPLGPWTKFEGNPIISKNKIGVNGTGHGDLFIDNQKNMRYVFHTHYSDKEVAPRRTALINLDFVQDKNSKIDLLVPEINSFQYIHQ
jgi:beta-xylosidase